MHRVDLLDTRVKALISSGTKVTRVNLTQAMEDAALSDLRVETVLPQLLRVIDDDADHRPATAEAVARLKAWQSHGGQRKETTAGQQGLLLRRRDPADGRVVAAAGQGRVPAGPGRRRVQRAGVSWASTNRPPASRTEPRATAVSRTRARRSRSAGRATSTRTSARSSVTAVAGPARRRSTAAAATSPPAARCCCRLADARQRAPARERRSTRPTRLRGGRPVVRGHDRANRAGRHHAGHDQLQNRPTFQQVVEFPAHRGDNIANLAAAEDGDARPAPKPASTPPRRRTQSTATPDPLGQRQDRQPVDHRRPRLAVKQVSRAVLTWEAAYGSVQDRRVERRKTWQDGGSTRPPVTAGWTTPCSRRSTPGTCG